MSTAAIAERIAREFQLLLPEHERIDLGGRTYMAHFGRVADRVEGDWTKAVAWLHDTVEDTPLTIGELGQRGVGEVVVAAVDLMTHAKGTTYKSYVDRIWANRTTVAGGLAYRVKIADLCDNLDYRRTIAGEDGVAKVAGLRAKHQPALDRLIHGRWLDEPLP